MKPINAKTKKTLKSTLRQNKFLLAKLLIECWNAETPHFGGSGPHRYDGNDKQCCYCNRPKDYKPLHSSFVASEICDEIDKKGA